MGQDGMKGGWEGDGMGWDGMGRDGTGWERKRFHNHDRMRFRSHDRMRFRRFNFRSAPRSKRDRR